MVGTITALILTVLMGGFIAYYGDLIGRKFGKKRVSMLGLRPKHTAILITSAFGILISALTTGFLFMLVPGVRNVILEGEEAIRNKKLFERQARESKLQAIAAGQKSLLAQQEAIVADNAKKRANEELSKIQLKLTDKQRKLEKSERSLQAAQAGLRDAKRTLHAAQLETAKARTEYTTQKRMSQNLAEKNVELATANHELSVTRDALKIEANGLKAEVSQLTKTRTGLAMSVQELTKHSGELALQNAGLSRENDEIAHNNENLLREKDRLTRENSRLASENEEQRRINKELLAFGRNQSGLFEKMRTGRIAIHGGEDLGRSVMPKNAPPDVIRRLLDQLMHDASVVAHEKGASANEGSGARAVQVVDKQFYTASSSGGPIPVHVTANERIEAVVNSLAWSDSAVCVLALAVANSVEGEPAAIDFQPFPDRLIYSKGYVLGSRRFDAAWQIEKLSTGLIGFLKDLGKAAIDRGMIPRMDPVTGEPQVGSMDIAEVVDVVDRIRAHNRPVKVTAVAREDLSASEPLKLEFRIENSL